MIEYESFTLDGNPRITRQTRFKPGTSTVLDSYTQEHVWNEHGERTKWTMPSYPSLAAPGWTQRVFENHDAVGNVDKIERSFFGCTSRETLLEGAYRAAGRPDLRTLHTHCAVVPACGSGE